MQIKIYFDEKPVYLCDEISPALNEILHHPDAVFMDEISNAGIKSLLHEIAKENFHAGILLHADLAQLKKAFFKHFQPIEAAGGIVQNEKKELLFIERLDKWDLPKGKVEIGEDIAACAIREVKEETGVSYLTIKEKIGETYHQYNAFGKHFLKTTHWFYMTCPSNQQLIPQTEEAITAIKWVKTKDIKESLTNTYPNIKDILAVFFDKP